VDSFQLYLNCSLLLEHNKLHAELILGVILTWFLQIPTSKQSLLLSTLAVPFLLAWGSWTDAF